MFDQIWWEYILVTKTPTERALLWCWLTSSWFVEESHLFTNHCINSFLQENLHVVVIHTRALHFAWCSPILSWPWIMFSKRVYYDLFEGRYKCREIDCFESYGWQIESWIEFSLIWLIFFIFSMFSKLSPCSPILDCKIQQFVQILWVSQKQKTKSDEMISKQLKQSSEFRKKKKRKKSDKMF